LDLWCSEVDGKRSWKLLFDVRSATQTDIAAHQAVGEREGLFDETLLDAAAAIIRATFQSPRSADVQPASASDDGPAADMNSPSRIVKRLEDVLGLPRSEWPTSLLRQLWSALIDGESGRWLSAAHEARWLNLTGFSLRPGYGLAVDDWRCNETWKLLQGKLAFNTTACRAEWYILWRRVAGGLTSGQQNALCAPLISQLKQAVRQPGAKGKSADFGSNTHESAELLRLLGACELLPIAVKHELGELLMELLGRPRFAAMADAALWALGRVGARRLVYGPLNLVIPSAVVSRWLQTLLHRKQSESLTMFAIMQLARKTGDRYRDIDDETRERVVKVLERVPSAKHYRELIAEVQNLESEDQSLIFGESLPKGLRIL
jgi:hypothetical protein